MIEFKIIKKSKYSRARLGIIKTDHGLVETPTLVPVATQATIKTLTSEEVEETKSQILICNTLYLHLKLGEKVIQNSGGLHQFMNWSKPLMTDSGGFQVFSWGFSKNYFIPSSCHSQPISISKILKKDFNLSEVKIGQKPKLLKITSEGVFFTSPFDGQKLFLGPKESIKIQEKIGADIMFTFDECTSPLADYRYTKKALLNTHRWAKICLNFKKSNKALFGIIQGGKFKDLRIESARFISSLPFDGFGIGGEFGNDKKKMSEILNWVIKELPEEKPRHLLGIGYLDDIPKIIKGGIDLFDCVVPTHYARRGIGFTTQGKLDLKKSDFLTDKNPIDRNCFCFVCQNYKRNYICHLFKAKEITALKLLTFHNLYFFNDFIKKIREKIKKNKI